MIKCPNCQHQELPGALFCSECGAQIMSADTLTSPLEIQDAENIDKIGLEGEEESIQHSGQPENFRETVIMLRLLDYDRNLSLSGRAEYSLGRAAKGQPILPDVDLTDFDAYSQGVSRLHASIKVGQQKIVIMDLRSANGTRINGQKITSNVEYPIKHGDVISLGKLKIQILLY